MSVNKCYLTTEFCNNLLLVLILFSFSSTILATTTIENITASPATFSPSSGEATTITVVTEANVANLQIHVFSSDHSEIIKSTSYDPLDLIESTSTPGTYTTTWNGKNNSNQIVPNATYAIRVYNGATATYLGPWAEVTVVNDFSISATPNPFLTAGDPENPLSIRVGATPNKTNLKYSIYHRDGDSWLLDRSPLTETAPGVYTATWDGVKTYYSDTIPRTGNCTIYIYDSDGTRSSITESLRIETIDRINRSVSSFNPSDSETVTFTTNGVSGLNLELRVSNQSGEVIRTLDATELSNGNYGVVWDGRNEDAQIAVGSRFNVQFWNKDFQKSYSPTSYVDVESVVISATPNPFISTGNPANSLTITVESAPGQSGLKYSIYHRNGNGWILVRNPLTETSPGVYTATWNGIKTYYADYIPKTGNCTIYVYDSNGTQSSVYGSFRIETIGDISRSVSSFNPSNSETVTFSTSGASGLNLELRVTNQSNELIRTLDVTETEAGSYTVEWDGRDENSQIAVGSRFNVQFWNKDSQKSYSPTNYVDVESIAISATPNPFIATANPANPLTVTVESAPGQSGLKYSIYHRNGNGWILVRNPLTETSPGVYTATWNGIKTYYADYIPKTGNCTIYVYDSNGTQSSVYGSFRIETIGDISRSVSSFNPSNSETVTFSTSGASGLNLELRVTNQSNELIRTLDVTETEAGSYTVEWDGRDENSQIAAGSRFNVQFWNKDSQKSYSPTSNVNLESIVITATPNPFIVGKSIDDSLVVTVETAPNQSGLKYSLYHHSGDGWLHVRKPLTETSPGVYTATWNGIKTYYSDYVSRTGDCTIYVYDSFGTEFSVRGSTHLESLNGVIDISPSTFTPGANALADITVTGVSGLNLEAVVYNGNIETRRLSMVETNGTYLAQWDGKDGNGNYAGARTYTIRIANKTLGKQYAMSRNISVLQEIDLSVNPREFTPNGVNEATITLLANPGQIGLYATVRNTKGNQVIIPLTETETSGRYECKWNGEFSHAIAASGICNIRAYNSSGTAFSATSDITINSVENISVVPTSFDPNGTNQCDITVNTADGFSDNLEIHIGNAKVLPLTNNGDNSYSLSWNGELNSNEMIAAGSYDVRVYNSSSNKPYNINTSLNIVDQTAPTVTITSGAASGDTVGADVEFSWQGSDNLTATSSLRYSYRLDDAQWSQYGSNTSVEFELQAGAHIFELKAIDLSGNETSPVLSINFNVATAPIINTITDMTIEESKTFTYEPTLSQGDSSQISWMLISGPIGMTIDPVSGKIIWPNPIASPEDYYVTIRATNGFDYDTQSFSLKVPISYSAFVSTSVDTIPTGSPVPLEGMAMWNENSATPDTPAANVDVLIAIEVKGFMRKYVVTTDENGNFEFNFQPLSNEAGYYSIRADHPSLSSEDFEDHFTLVALSASPSTLDDDIFIGQPLEKQIVVENLGDTALTGVSAELINIPEDVAIDLQEPNDLLSLEHETISFTTTVNNSNVSFNNAKIRFTCDQGAIVDIPLEFNVKTLTPDIVLSENSIKEGMVLGEQKLVEFTITNQGGAPAKNIKVHLPQASWLSLSSPDSLQSLAPNEQMKVTMLLNPSDDMILGPYRGSVYIDYDNTYLSVPFEFIAISQNRGDVSLTITDEMTYADPNTTEGAGAKVSGAHVILTEPDTDIIVAEGYSNSQGMVHFTDVAAGTFNIEVREKSHSNYRGAFEVKNAITNEAEIFISKTFVKYDFNVVYDQVEDSYKIVVESTFETTVPVPVVTVEFPPGIFVVIDDEPTQLELTVTNNGLIEARDVEIKIPDVEGLHASVISEKIDVIPAKTSIKVPVILTGVEQDSPNALSCSSLGTNDAAGAADALVKCLGAKTKYSYVCGKKADGSPRKVNKYANTAMKVLKAGKDFYDKAKSCIDCGTDIVTRNITGGYKDCLCGCMSSFMPDCVCALADVESLAKCACNLGGSTPEVYGGGSGGSGSGDFGGSGGGGGVIGPSRTISRSECNEGSSSHSVNASADAIESQSEAVCARVKIRLDQDMVLTRTILRATLSLENGSANHKIEDVNVTLNITDENYEDANDKFIITNVALTNITNIDGTGELGEGQNGSVEFEIFPALDAAPEEATMYGFGGSFSYTLDGQYHEVELVPTKLLVYPEPRLSIRYFHQKDVFSDDPFTQEIEPAEPFTLGIMVTNSGAGTAYNFNITSSEPKIIENEKGLLIDFKLLGTTLDGETIDNTFKVDFGDIGPNETKVGQWLLSASLQGKFVDYNATFEHTSGLGDNRPSLLDSVEIHELIHTLLCERDSDDNITDFLVNDIEDDESMPDTIYLSDSSVEDVVVLEASADSTINSYKTSCHILLDETTNGWAYMRINDPGNGNYELLSVTRDSDGKNLLVGKNVWLTNRTIHPVNSQPYVEKYLHIVDFNPCSSYTVTYKSGDTQKPEIINVAASDITTPNTLNNNILISLQDNQEIDISSLDSADIKVVDPLGNELSTTLIGSSSNNDNSNCQVTYQLSWQDGELLNGVYSIVVEPMQISDTNANYIDSAVIGSFVVNINPIDYVSLSNYELVSSTRVGRTIYRHQYKIVLNSSLSRPLTNKRFVVENQEPNIRLLKNSVEFAQITPGVNISQANIILEVDHSSDFDINNLQWRLINYLRSDFNLDGNVDVSDLAILCSSWLDNDSSVDLDGSGTIDLLDISIFAQDWVNN